MPGLLVCLGSGTVGGLQPSWKLGQGDRKVGDSGRMGKREIGG